MGESCSISLVSFSEEQIRTNIYIEREDHMKTQGDSHLQVGEASEKINSADT